MHDSTAKTPWRRFLRSIVNGKIVVVKPFSKKEFCEKGLFAAESCIDMK